MITARWARFIRLPKHLNSFGNALEPLRKSLENMGFALSSGAIYTFRKAIFSRYGMLVDASQAQAC